jgi:hypothetical protein
MKSFLKQIEESFYSLEEKKTRPDFLDLDGDGDTEEPMKTAAKENVSIHEGYYSSSPLETIIGSLGYRDGFQEFFEDNPGAVDTVVEWIISIRDFRTQLINEYDPEELETMGIYDLDEASTSAGAGSYMTPKAFGKADDDTVETLGYKRVQEAMDTKYERLIEGYKTFALSDSKMSPAKKVNASIKNVAKQLKEIEDTVKYTSRLKTESGISHSGFGPSISKALGKISERLIKISERVRSLGE